MPIYSSIERSKNPQYSCQTSPAEQVFNFSSKVIRGLLFSIPHTPGAVLILRPGPCPHQPSRVPARRQARKLRALGSKNGTRAR